MLASCAVLGPPDWFEQLRTSLEPNTIRPYRLGTLEELQGAVGAAEIYVLAPRLPRRDYRAALRQLGQSRFGDPLRLVVADEADEIDRVVAFELGADDFVSEPVSFREIALRVAALLRRNQRSPHTAEADTVQHGALLLDADAMDAWVDGRRVGLTASEFRLLRELAASPGVVLRREALLRSVWGADLVNTRTVDTHIKRIRKKLGDFHLVQTVRGVGYRLRVARNR